MQRSHFHARCPLIARGVTAVVVTCMAFLAPCEMLARAYPAQAQPAATPAAATPAAKIPNDQLDSLVAPIALYPDPLLSQTLVASTYPLEIIQLQQWLEKNKDLKDKALTDAALKQPWDASIQAMVALPDVVNRLANDIQWTTDLGNAFLAQQSDVMDAVQRMRKKAQGTGALASNEQQKVETKVVENKTVIVVEPARTEVVYVPTYSPVVVYGPPIYPYPPIYYPPYPTGAVVAASMISFGVGIAVGAAWGGGGWGWGCGWGGNDIDINVNNNFIRNNNIRIPTSAATASATPTSGSTTRIIEAARRMRTRRPPTSSAAQPVAIRWRRDSRMRSRSRHAVAQAQGQANRAGSTPSARNEEHAGQWRRRQGRQPRGSAQLRFGWECLRRKLERGQPRPGEQQSRIPQLLSQRRRLSERRRTPAIAQRRNQ